MAFFRNLPCLPSRRSRKRAKERGWSICQQIQNRSRGIPVPNAASQSDRTCGSVLTAAYPYAAIDRSPFQKEVETLSPQLPYPLVCKEIYRLGSAIEIMVDKGGRK